MISDIEEGWEEALGIPLTPNEECCMYVINCKANDKKYVGITNDLARRFEEHMKRTEDNYKMSRAVKKYGKDAFEIRFFLHGSREFCCLIETSLIWIYDSFEAGYNSSKGGEGSSYHTPWNKGTKGLCKPNKTSFVAGGESPRKKLTEEDIQRILLEYDSGIVPKQMNWLPVHWSNAYRAIKKHRK